MAFMAKLGLAGETQRYELKPGETVIGRHPDCDVIVDVGAVSRVHAKIMRRGNDYFLEDQGSRNGTFLNGQLINGSQSLSEGDKVRICEVELVFHGDAAPAFVTGTASDYAGGSTFGVTMIDDEVGEDSAISKVEFRSGAEGFRIAATAEAKLAALMKINANLSEALALDEVLPKVLTTLFEIFPQADRGFVVLKDAEGNLIPRWVKMRRADDETKSVRISRTIIREAMSSRTALLSLDASNDQRFDSSQSIADFSIKSMVCAPLTDGQGESFGALQIDSTEGRGQFREDDVDLLSGVAGQAAIVIRNSQMHERTLKQQEVEQDLRLATDVQQAFLPQSAPNIPGYRVCSYYQAAQFIGGDYFDYIPLPDGRWAIVAADVVGHGVAAAMFMAKLSAETRFCLAAEPDLAAAIERLNDNMSQLGLERFVTFLMMVLGPSGDDVRIVNAGHMAPLVFHAADGSTSEPGEEESGLPIGIDEGMSYEATSLTMKPGDVAVMYTDGINEAMNAADELYSIDRIRACVAQGGGADVILNRIVSEVRAFIGKGRQQDDDMCMVVIERIAE
ncbi:MAG: FHA domain-containing protein [Planctomycetaceae bacterium]|nr:MAG: FHA domain-containing protein [Planctomycetaceae bacterium]